MQSNCCGIIYRYLKSRHSGFSNAHFTKQHCCLFSIISKPYTTLWYGYYINSEQYLPNNLCCFKMSMLSKAKQLYVPQYRIFLRTTSVLKHAEGRPGASASGLIKKKKLFALHVQHTSHENESPVKVTDKRSCSLRTQW